MATSETEHAASRWSVLDWAGLGVVGVPALVFALSVGQEAPLRGAIPALGAAADGLVDLYFFLLEALFWVASSTEAALGASAALLASAIALRLARPLLGRLPRWPRRVVREILWAPLCVSAVLAQLYLLAFAGRTQPWLLGALMVAALAAYLGARRADPAGLRGRVSLDDVPLVVVLFLVGVHLMLGLVMGHTATPLVHDVAAWMAALSDRIPPLYRLLATGLLLAPALAWWSPRTDGLPLPRGTGLRAAVAVGALAILALPTAWVLPLVGLSAAALLGWVLARRGVTPIAPPLPLPSRLLISLLFVSAVASCACTLHYTSVMWRCPGDAGPGIRRVSSLAGTFDLVTRADGERLVVSLREPQRLVELDRRTGEVVGVLDTADAIDASGHLFSRVEPETLLTLDDDQRVLALMAVSDDENANRIAVLDGDLRIQGFVGDLPRTCIADIVSLGEGRVGVSTEFDGAVHVVDSRSLRRIRDFRWAGAETNRILLDPDSGRLYSLGLWFDPRLRKGELASGRELTSVEVGTRSWDLALDPVGGRIYIPRLVSGDVGVFDAETLDLVDRWPAGFGARPVEVDAAARRLFVGGMYDGRVHVYDLDSGDHLRAVRVGGYIKGLRADPDTGRVYTGCACGIYELDPAAL